MGFFIAIGVIFLIAMFMTIKVVPQQEAWVIERFGRFERVFKEGGLQIIIPMVQRVAYKHSLKEQVIEVSEQAAITKDNVTLNIDGILYVKVIDPVEASYGVSNPYNAVTQLAQTTMRAEIGKITLERTFEEREAMNANIVTAINDAAVKWGVQCMRYEIRNIMPPKTVLQAMELQVAADRQKRAEILNSEGKSQAVVNLASADKQQVVLRSEAALTDQVNRAKGQAEAIRAVAIATADGIREVAKAITEKGGADAVTLRVAEKYVEAFKELAKESTTLLLPANASDAGSMVAQAMAVFETARKNLK
jgi:regulator of protease activity HflC (stomatin/prohibitin superfamily)